MSRLDRLHDAIVEMGAADAPSQGELNGALRIAGLELCEAGDERTFDDIDDPAPAAPPPLSFVIRHTACELALQMGNIAGRGATDVLKDAEKFRAFLAGEGPAPTDQHGGKT